MRHLDETRERAAADHSGESSLNMSLESATYPAMQDLAELFARPDLALATSVRYEDPGDRGSTVEIERRGHGYLVALGERDGAEAGTGRIYSMSPHGEISELAEGAFVKRYDWQVVKEIANAIRPVSDALSGTGHRLEWRNAAGHVIASK